MIAKTMGMILVLSSLLLLSACEQEGPAERAGEKIDNAIESAGDKIEQAGDKIQEKTR
ncbi:MAG: hypothetical protein KDI82_03775 [Gammaproteobacteria bacterium]|nr:hypothetical protein [Gammaproteobacteria bacterium]